MTFRIRLAGILAVVPLAFVAQAGAAPHILNERAVVTHHGYWTRARMEGATPASASGAAWDRGGLVARTTGRVFFTLGGADYSCSGSTVGGANPDLVVTAAHCVSDGAGNWAVNWTFIPGYHAGQMPYGSFAAKTFFVSGKWASGANPDDDIAFVAVRPSRVGNAVRTVGSVVGSQPIAFGYRGASAWVFGYPAEDPYTGDQLDYCSGRLVPDPNGTADVGMPCAMTEGDSGGPWLSDFDPRTGKGVITGVTSFKYAGQTRMLYSVTLGSAAQSLYNKAEYSRLSRGVQTNPPDPLPRRFSPLVSPGREGPTGPPRPGNREARYRSPRGPSVSPKLTARRSSSSLPLTPRPHVTHYNLHVTHYDQKPVRNVAFVQRYCVTCGSGRVTSLSHSSSGRGA
ncbi:MAG TPA: trypsin-like serine protease [Streptosporangiaceae bacterium]